MSKIFKAQMHFLEEKRPIISIPDNALSKSDIEERIAGIDFPVVSRKLEGNLIGFFPSIPLSTDKEVNHFRFNFGEQLEVPIHESDDSPPKFL